MSTRHKQFCLGIITARGGSKGVPNKNIRPLAGKPLIVHTIEAARGCALISNLLVTTDSQNIADVAKEAGAMVPFLRPAELSGDLAKQEDAIIHAMEWCEHNDLRHDYIMLLMPTSPLRRTETLTVALQKVKDDPAIEALYAVAEVSLNIFFCNLLRPDGTMKNWVKEEYKWANRQELPTYYALSGLYCLSKWDTFKRERTFVHDNTHSVVVDSVESLDINSPYDFLVADFLMRQGIRCSEDISQAHIPGDKSA